MSDIKVFAPATVGNCIVGFDTLGLALEKPGDEIIVRFSKTPGLHITKITGANGLLPFEVHKNTAGWAAYKLLEHLGETSRGIEMEIHKKMPFGSGLGSSAASAVAGAYAINELLSQPLDKSQLLPFAMEGEMLVSGARFADNVAPSLLGGVILIRDNDTLDVHRLNIPDGLFATVIYPHIEILTAAARNLLPTQVPLKTMVAQSANLASFVLGMFRSDLELISRSLQDLVVEPKRAALIPDFYEIKHAALEAGALGCSISGSGPSIFALSPNKTLAEKVADSMQKIYTERGLPFDVFLSPINQEGAVRC